MKNTAGPSEATRKHVLKVARALGYVPDPHLASFMAQVRETKVKDFEPIAWLSDSPNPSVWETYKFLAPYYHGARQRALQLGYRIELVATNDEAISMSRVAKMIYNRGIPGVIVTHEFKRRGKLYWNSLAAIGLEGAMFAPRLSQVKTDHFYNLLLALKMLRRFGYNRIGLCLEDTVDRRSFHIIRSALLYFQTGLPKGAPVPPLFYEVRKRISMQEGDRDRYNLVVAWTRKHRPDVILCLHEGVERWLTKAGYRVPEEIGIAHLATDDDVSDWAGIHSKRSEIGAAAVEQVVSLIQNRQFGVPQTPISMEIRGVWHNGRTLLTPKPK